MEESLGIDNMDLSDQNKIIKNGFFRGTPFHNSSSLDVAAGFWYGWGEYAIPDVYSSMYEELHAIRNTVGVIDMSPLPKMCFEGKDSANLLDKLMTRSISDLAIGRCLYTPWCNEDGLLIGDGIVFRLSERKYIVAGENSISWFQSNINNMSVEVVDNTHDYGVLSVQGPHSEKILSKVIGKKWKEIDFSALAFHEIAGIQVFVARQGFTGEKGYEIWTPSSEADKIRDTIMEIGVEFGALPVGEYAVDIARIEAGLILVSADYAGAGPDEKCANVTVDKQLTISPIEAGLSRLVEYDVRKFVGKEALEASASLKDQNCFLGLHINLQDMIDIYVKAKRPDEMLSRVYWGSTKVYLKGNIIGRASSICWSPTLNKPIAFCFVKKEVIEIGDNIDLEIKSADGSVIGLVSANVVNLPFVKIKRSEN